MQGRRSALSCGPSYLSSLKSLQAQGSLDSFWAQKLVKESLLHVVCVCMCLSMPAWLCDM